jgi:hypothetical protein
MSDHDILIQINTLIGVLSTEFRDLKKDYTSNLSLKADKSEVAILRELLSSFESKDKENRSEIKQALKDMDTRLDGLATKTAWIVGIGVGVLGAIQVAIAAIGGHFPIH